MGMICIKGNITVSEEEQILSLCDVIFPNGYKFIGETNK